MRFDSSRQTIGREEKNLANPQSDANRAFPIVALGASAGGLEALTLFIAELPDKPEMGLVIIQHLSPDHKSELAKILSRNTRIPISEITGDTPVRPGHIHIIPSHADISISNGVIHLTERSDAGWLHMPIDDFMQSLAEDQLALAIGVVLSGTGSDGSRGLECIKKVGGITFAQEPESANQSGMPEAAIDAGVVDFILTPAEIARELLRISQHPYLTESAPESAEIRNPATKEEMAAITGILKSAKKVDFAYYRETTLKRRILRRMLLHKIVDFSEYARRLKGDPREIDALYQEILINVTRFFRDTSVFEYLKESIYPQIQKSKESGSEIRIWVVGCATGEEAYSLAMIMLEFQDGQSVRWPFRIFASDIDPTALDMARKGIYPESIREDVSETRLNRFFTKDAGTYRIHKSIRDLCVFAHHDMAADPPFSRLDLISCRNMLIYLMPPLQRRILPVFHYALNPTGFLLLGNSESVGRNAELFNVVEGKLKIFSRKMTPSRLPAQTFIKDNPHEALRPMERPRQSPTMDFEQSADRIMLRRFAPPSVLVSRDLDILQFRGRTSPYLEPPQGDAAFNLVKMAHESLFLPIREAILEADGTGEVVRKSGIQMRVEDQSREVDLEIIPIKRPNSPETAFLVLFEPSHPRNAQAAEAAPKTLLPLEEENQRLRQDLASARDYMNALREQFDTVNEDLKTTNEELLSSNEEHQSANEELETAKEEMQSSNEELTTMNDELKSRNWELTNLNNDVNNLLTSIGLPLVLLMLGPDLRIRRFSATAGKVLGLGPADLGRAISDIRIALDIPDLADLIQGVMDSDRPCEKEVLDREKRWFHLNIFPYRTAERAVEKRIEGAVVVLHDIHELIHAKIELAESAEYSGSIVNTMKEPLLVLDGDLKVRTANASFYETFGIRKEDMEGRNLYRLGNGNWELPVLKTMMEEILPQNNTFDDFEMEQDISGLGARTLLLNARRLLRDGGLSPLILMGIEDITERKRADQELKLFKFICDKSNDPYYLMDREARFLYVNRSAYTGLGFSEAELLSMRLKDIDKAMGDARFQTYFDTAQTSRIPPFESTHLTRKGERFPVEYSVTGLNFGGHARLFAVVRDISESKRSAEILQQSEEKLRQSQKVEAIGKLAGGVAHDFNNILTAINGYSDLSLSLVDANSPLHENLLEIHKAGQRAASLTRQLLAYSRNQILAPKVLNLNSTSADMQRMLERLIGENIVLKTDLAPDLGMVKADPAEMEQVIVNLVVNARDAMPEGGAITLETRNVELDEEFTVLNPLVLPGRYVRMSVTDTGSGMDADVKARIFDPFFTTKELGKGSGLGLSMVQGIVSQSGGFITIRSEPGSGSTFEIHLPHILGEPIRTERTHSGLDTEFRGDEVVLLVEDEDTVRTFTRKILEMHGYTVLEAEDGRTALALESEAGDRPIHVLLTDVIMPGMNGRELADRFQKVRPESQVLFMSGYTDNAITRQGLLDEHTFFLQKPFTPSQLIKALKDVLRSNLEAREGRQTI